MRSWDDAYKVHAHETHARDMHAYEMNARQVYSHKIHPRDMHAHKTHAHEMHAYEVHAHEDVCEDLASQNTVACLFQLQLEFPHYHIYVSVLSHMGFRHRRSILKTTI